jgi:short-subunit dehydrogenase
MTAIVTGASSGLGKAIAELLAQRMPVVGVSRRGPSHILGDAADPSTAQRTIAAAEQLGPIDLLVNCAGAGVFGPAGSYDEHAIDAVLDANLKSTIVFCNALFPAFQARGGTIVNVLSTAALIGKPNESVYCAAKWGARGYTEALRAEAKGTKARVISVAPGGMDTPFWPERRADFMDPKEIAAVIVDAIDRRVNVTELVIAR